MYLYLAFIHFIIWITHTALSGRACCPTPPGEITLREDHADEKTDMYICIFHRPANLKFWLGVFSYHFGVSQGGQRVFS
jgi:hypothetical protein